MFDRFYRLLESGETGVIAEDELEPLVDIPALADLDVDAAAVREALGATVVIKLNGGLATSMGLDRAKSLLVGEGRPVVPRHHRPPAPHRSGRARRDALPLVLMNSFRTRDDSLAALAAHPGLAVDGLPLDIVQHREPKLRADDLAPVDWPQDPELTWCPPGHADLYPTLRATGLLDQLLDRGLRWAFCSNADNLGATVDGRIAAWMAAEEIPFVMEAATRTAADRKGGHLARRRARRSAAAARGGPDRGRRPRRVPGHRPPPVLQHQQRVDRPARAARRARPQRRRARPAGDPQRQDGRPAGPVARRRSSRSSRRWGRRSRSSTVRAPCSSAATGSCR